MISWALKRNTESARDAPGADDTQIEQPDTPGPVFAVRALKTALFGTPAPRHSKPAKPRVTVTDQDAQPNLNQNSVGDKSPVKPAGILLTPGTATARRKRVSFGHDVKAGAAAQGLTSATGLPDDCPGKFPSPWIGDKSDRPKTRLTQAMERSRNSKPKEAATDARDTAAATVKETDDGWEEVDDESDYELDVTVDLNEPHSRSGKYWKSYFESYHADAKAEMEKLVKYKELAKSYAKKKDAEAIDLNEKLKEEQEKLRLLEKEVAEMGRQVRLRAKKDGASYDPSLASELEKQTALALEYKHQVEELEFLLQDEDDEVDDKGPRQRRIASPRTQKTLLETQRELRRARAQAKELEKTKEERDRLRSELRFAEQHASKLADENKRLSGDLEKSASRIQDLEKKVEESKALYEKIKDDAKARYVEAQRVLQRKNEKISELQAETGSLRRERAESRWTTRAKNLEAKLKAGSEDVLAPDPETALKFLETAEEESTQLLKELHDLRQVSIQRGLLVPAKSAAAGNYQTKARKRIETRGRSTHEDEALISSRAFREKIEAEMSKNPSSVLTDRGNLQDSRSSASSGQGVQQSAAATKSREEKEKSLRPSRTERSSRVSSSSATNLRAKGAAAGSDSVPGAGERRTRPTQPAVAPAAAPVESLRKKLPPPSELLDSEQPHIDLVQDNFARLGGPDMHSSAVWSMNASRATLPADRRAAAIARLQRKKAERSNLPDRNKENMNPY